MVICLDDLHETV